MKLFIWTDLEGVAGVLTPVQTGEEKGEAYKNACRLLTLEVNAAVEAALRAGATEVVVSDLHGMGFNLILEEIHPSAKVICGPGRIQWLAGLDSSFEGILLLGAHAMAGTRYAILEHTMSSKAWFNYYLDGRCMGEIGMTAVCAGTLDVPVIFVSGDKAACEEARALLKDVETASIKEGLARTAGILIPPVKARQMISEAVTRAVKRIKDFKPYKVTFPAEVKVEAQNTAVADAWERQGWERVDGRTVRRMAASVNEMAPR